MLKAKTYQLAQAGEEDDALTGDLDVVSGSGRLAIVGKGRAKTTIDGNGVDRILEVLEGGRLTVSGLTLTDGGITGGGGALWNQGSASLRELAVRGNFAGAIGGGIFNSGDGRLAISRSRISSNEAAFGGGIWAENEGSVTIARSRITGNRALDFGGGGIYNANESRMRISRSTVSGNSAVGNSQDGGGIYNQHEAQATIKDSTISGNTASHQGGGIYTQNDSRLVLRNTTLSGNRAEEGGGIYGNNYPYIRINFSTIAKNSATTAGGAIYANTAGNNLLRPSVLATEGHDRRQELVTRRRQLCAQRRSRPQPLRFAGLQPRRRELLLLHPRQRPAQRQRQAPQAREERRDDQDPRAEAVERRRGRCEEAGLPEPRPARRQAPAGQPLRHRLVRAETALSTPAALP